MLTLCGTSYPARPPTPPQVMINGLTSQQAIKMVGGEKVRWEKVNTAIRKFQLGLSTTIADWKAIIVFVVPLEGNADIY